MSLDVNNIFRLSRSIELGGEDYNILSQFYLPIMGIDSYSLYMYLNSLKDGETYQFKKLIDALNLHTPKFLEKAFSKLEALSLIKLFEHEERGYFVYLDLPVCRKSFLENPILSSFLYEQIGEVEFSKISKIDLRNPRGYKNITKSFDDVFEFQDESIENIFNKIFKLKTKSPIKITNPNFDYIFFKMNFDTDFVDPKVLDDEEFMNHILSVSFNYQLNEEEMKEVIINTIEIDKDLTLTDISKNARNYYRDKDRKTKRVVVTKEPDAFIASSLDDETFLLMEKLEKTDPITLLGDIGGGIKAAASEVKLIEKLQQNTNFPQGVINFMILVISNQNNGVIPGYAYFEKVANTWARAGITNVVEAAKYIQDQNEKRKEKPKTTYVRNRKSAPIPDWYEKYKKDLESVKEKPQEISEEEMLKIFAEVDDVL